jgi:DNA-binding NarL/FixJ family response regulator
VVVDPAMDGGGTGLLRELLKAIPQLRIVMYSSVEDALSVQRALAAGAHGYVTRRDPAVDVLTAILSALDGERHVGPRVRHVLLDELAHGAMKINGKPESVLSDRELQVFRLIGGGRKTCEIAEDLGVSAKTIETHRQRIKEKLHLHSGAELQQRAALSSNQKRQAKGSYRG